MISSFDNKYSFLSNFHPALITYEGLTYQSAEAAFQAAKAETLTEREPFTKMLASRSKRMGRKVKLRSNWDKIKDEQMYNILKIKFAKGSSLANLLLETGEEELVEGNTWHDNYWGSCYCSDCHYGGLNKLGELLMVVRAELRGEIQEWMQHAYLNSFGATTETATKE